MPYPDRQNCWPYDEPATSTSAANLRNALIGLACVVGVLLYCFL